MIRYPRFLSMLAAIMALTAILSSCMHAGILVAPTAPPDGTAGAAESTVSGETQATIPTETSAPQETLPEVSTVPPETEIVESTAPQETITATEPTAPQETTAPTEAAPAEPPEPTEAPPVETTAPVETTTPPETTEAAGSALRHDPHDLSSYSISSAEQALLDQIHAMRAEKQLPQLTTDKALCALAYLRAYESTTQFSHLRPDGNSYTAIFTEYDYLCTNSGENILKAEDWYPANYILDDWLFAQATADNLSNPAFTHLGVGIYETGGYIYVVCLLTAK